MDAVVYVSETGYTEKYAAMLSAELGTPLMSLKEAKNKLRKGAEIIYLGWISADYVKGLSKARKLFEVKAIGGVGLGAHSEKTQKSLEKTNKTGDIPAFYLQGGFDFEKLNGFNKFLMKIFAKVVESDMTSGKHNMMHKDEAEEMLDAFINPKDYVTPDKLQPMLERCRTL